jgi:hypothetical protein
MLPIPVDIALLFSQVIFSLATWKWRRWGAYGLISIQFTGFFINLVFVTSLAKDVGYLISASAYIIVLGLLLRHSWKYFS